MPWIATWDRHRGSAGGKPTPWPLTREVVGVAAERALLARRAAKSAAHEAEKRGIGSREGKDRRWLRRAPPKGRLHKPGQTRRACRPPVPGPGSRALKIGLPQDARRDATSDGGYRGPHEPWGAATRACPIRDTRGAGAPLASSRPASPRIRLRSPHCRAHWRCLASPVQILPRHHRTRVWPGSFDGGLCATRTKSYRF